uniref:alcohol dehydrogenase catalytic domain-containing protein n=1 Tax=Acidiplasma cupricumulans TaxID=312540 RepID=UPI000B072B0D
TIIIYMKACVLEKYGEYPIYKDVNAPEIEEDDDIIIKVAGVGVCRTDIHEIFGNLKDRTRLPLILGHETLVMYMILAPRYTIFQRMTRLFYFPT